MATMTRQNYEMLARTLGYAVAVEACEGGGEGSRAAGAAYRVALAVADALTDTNPAYDHCRFLDAVEKHADKAAHNLGGDSWRDGTRYQRGAYRAMQDALAQRRAGCPSSSRINI
jgi:hypothetical protein